MGTHTACVSGVLSEPERQRPEHEYERCEQKCSARETSSGIFVWIELQKR